MLKISIKIIQIETTWLILEWIVWNKINMDQICSVYFSVLLQSSNQNYYIPIKINSWFVSNGLKIITFAGGFYRGVVIFDHLSCPLGSLCSNFRTCIIAHVLIYRLYLNYWPWWCAYFRAMKVRLNSAQRCVLPVSFPLDLLLPFAKFNVLCNKINGLVTLQTEATKIKNSFCTYAVLTHQY